MLREAKENGLDLHGQHEIDESGWDFLVLHATATDGTRWILRAPRRPGEHLHAEAALLDHVRPVLPVAVPDWRIHTDTLIAYPRLPGDQADESWLPTDDTLGRCVAILHSLPTEPIEDLGVEAFDPDRQRSWLAGKLATAVREFDIPDDKLRRWRDWLDATDRWPQDMVLVRGDLHPQHMLVDDGRLVGLIDWADATISDPSLDFVDPYHHLSTAAFERLLTDYERHGGRVWPGMREHIALRASVGPVIGAVFGLENGRDDLVAESLAELSRSR